jgi:hypothetical protein
VSRLSPHARTSSHEGWLSDFPACPQWPRPRLPPAQHLPSPSPSASSARPHLVRRPLVLSAHVHPIIRRSRLHSAPHCTLGAFASCADRS